MIASPGDVQEERTVVRSCIYDWNDVNAASARIFLAPVGWETHSSPELGTRPQELINKRILQDCDILVGVFWTRLGSPTGKSASGTVEEIEEHRAAGKPAMLYFSARPAAPETIDGQQLEALNIFKSKCKSDGLIETFDTVEELRAKFTRQLSICVAKNPHLKATLEELVTTASGVGPIQESAGHSVRLSEDAKTLLKAAASDKDGTILKMETLANRQLFVGKLSFGGEGARDYARWDSAFRELFDADLLIGRGNRGAIFELTHLGWTVAGKL
jgi:hypothetical protein